MRHWRSHYQCGIPWSPLPDFEPPSQRWVFLDSFSSIYSHLVLNAHINTRIVNKDTSSWEDIIWIWFNFCVVEPIWIPRDILILRHHLSRQKMILLEISILHSIFLDCIYFIGSAMNLYKLIGITFGPFAFGHFLGIYLLLYTPCMDQPLDILEPNMTQSKVPLDYNFMWRGEVFVGLVSYIDSTCQCLELLLSLVRESSFMSWKVFFG